MIRLLFLVSSITFFPLLVEAKEIIKRSDDNCFEISIIGTTQSMSFDPEVGHEERCHSAQDKATKAMKYYELGHKAYIDGNYKKTIEYYSKASEWGDYYAPYLLAGMFFEGDAFKQDYTKAVEWYVKAANNGMLMANYLLGIIYYVGDGVEKDYVKARKYFNIMLESGYIDANLFSMLGDLYLYGKGGKKDVVQGLRLLEQAVDLENSHAQFVLGFLYSRGEIVKQDSNKALKYIKQSASQNHVLAMGFLGRYYYYGMHGIEENKQKARLLFKKSGALGHGPAQKLLAKMYFEGEGGLEQNNDIAFKWIKQSAILGDSESQYQVGLAHLNLSESNETYDQAVNWLRKSALQGYDKAIMTLANLLLGKRINPSEAYAWFVLHDELTGKRTNSEVIEILKSKFYQDEMKKANELLSYYRNEIQSKKSTEQERLSDYLFSGIENVIIVDKSSYER